MNKILLGFLGFLFVTPVVAAVEVSGTVVNHDNEPLVGATVNAPGTTKGFVIYNSDGSFKEAIVVDADTSLEISYVNCTPQKFKASELKGKRIQLQCVTTIDDVVITAYSSAGKPGCDKEDNEYIAPDLALCSTHAYNIGADKNPTNEATRSHMREVIALKTTFMTQQMNKQYEYLEAMIRRFKTQLEKAVLKTRLQTSGASSDDSSGGSSSKSDDKYIILTGTQNCMKMGSIDASLSCLQSNIRIAMDAISAGNTRDASKQLKKDVETAVTMGVVKKESKTENDKVTYTGDTTYVACFGMSASKRDTVSDFATKLNYALMNYVDNRNWERTQKKDK